jgi:hypothetical protein
MKEGTFMGTEEVRGNVRRQAESLGNQRGYLQLAAMLTMLIDHIGFVIFPENVILRMIGRIAFPLYAFGIIQGYFYTSDLKKYIQRLGILALISQVPFMLAFEYVKINVIGTLFICICTLLFFERIQGKGRKVLIVAAALVILVFVPTDYGTYALLLIFTYRYSSAKWAIVFHLLLNVYYWITVGVWYQILSTLSTVWLALGHKRRLPAFSIPRWLWLSFYPAHLTLLAIVNWLFLSN